MLNSKLKDKVTLGISKLLLRELILKIITVLGQLLLVRTILPQYFGVFAILTFIFSLAEFFTDLGVSPAIIQKKGKISNSQISSLLILRETLSIIIVLIILLISTDLSNIFPVLKNYDQNLIYLFSTILLIKPIRSIIISLLDRDLNYGPIVKIDTVGIITYYIIALILAFNNFNIYSFVIALVIKEIVELIIALYYKPFIFTLNFNFFDIRKLVKFGFYIQLGNGILLAHDSLIPAIGGRVLSINSVGFLDWSKSISSLINTLLDNYSRAAFSGIAKIQDDKVLVTKSINKSIQYLNIPIIYFVVVLVSFSYDFVHYIASDKWLNSIPALQVFLISSLFAPSITAIGQGIVAIGAVKDMLIISGILTFLEILLAFILVDIYGFLGLPFAFLIHSVVQFISYQFLARKFRIFLDLNQTLISATIFIISLTFGIFLNSSLIHSFPSYMLKTFLLTCFYFLLWFIFSKQALVELVQLTRSAIIKK